jgi:hypothetical protein
MRRLLLILTLLLPVTVLGSSASLAQSKLEVRTETTLMNNGQSAVGTKLESRHPPMAAPL